MKKIILLSSLLFLTACVSGFNSSPETPASSTVSNVYTSQFPEVPIPMLMKTDPKNTLTTVNSAGEKLGRENFTGNMEASNLAAHMIQNLTSQSWSLIGTMQGEKSLQLYQKDTRYLIILRKGRRYALRAAALQKTRKETYPFRNLRICRRL